MTISDIERRLRFAAPEEPAVLPPLTLPADATAILRSGVRLRPRASQPKGIRFAYIAVALLLLAAAITVGALRLLNQERDPLAAGCDPRIMLEPGVDPCLVIPVPDGWQQVAAGQFFPGDFTEPGIGYEYVNLVLANVPLGSCATPGGWPVEPVPSNNVVVVPLPTPDTALACLRESALPENGIRVVVARGTRISGVGTDGAGIADNSEPTVQAGWTEQVGGRPARLTTTAGLGPGEPAETQVWDVLLPGSLGGLLRFTVDIAGPDVDAGRAAIRRFLDGVEFKNATPDMDAANANEVLRRALDTAEASAREMRSDFYACFPREPGTAAGTISGGPFAGVSDALAVTCTSSIAPSLAGVWRIVLEVSWPGTDAYAGDTLRLEFHTTGLPVQGGWRHQLELNGPYMTSLAGRPMPDIGAEAWLPTANYQLPAPVAGPLDIPAGSIVEMLWPGEAPAEELGNGEPADSYSSFPGIVSTHLYVLEGPVLIEDDEWYRVQSSFGGYEGIGWVRGKRDGRPQLVVVEPSCPPGDISAGDLAWITPAERLACFGDADLTLAPSVLSRSDDAAPVMECPDEAGGYGPCPTDGGDPDWITRPSLWTLYGADGPAGPDLALQVWLHPTVQPPVGGGLVRVKGHFDDREASGCRWPANGSYGQPNVPEVEEMLCRQRFVVTAIESL